MGTCEMGNDGLRETAVLEQGGASTRIKLIWLRVQILKEAWARMGSNF